MKGFGNNDRTNKKSIEKKVKDLQKDKLISNALSLHTNCLLYTSDAADES